ncbi:TIGR04283 family arsenosugar biosynthesis glycosyltransferase [uncultured Dokdonia sp.]|uniref:TIGR04283 family arsenosugar biosynthesis glycosyltransferase n=1 Tax=uncultured Dokdonia sp. TaxID=575653 RepID=UPI00261E3DFB|nr:TIGR04283 family arsenosugar biosynthesis glycosyltransferase [uncultured Dokdonia sp.]
MGTPKISIIIPTLNEAENISRLLKHLVTSKDAKTSIEIIIVDGGSEDNTLAIIQNHSTQDNVNNIHVITAPKGRAKQMNAGASIAKGAILYFLHADSFPPKGYDQNIISEVSKGNHAGCFRMCFDSNHWWLRLASWLTQFSWRACRGGDQSQFITKDLFEELGRYDERFIIYEDNDLINKLYARKEFVVINKKITTSSRRYKKNGIWKLQYHFWAIYVKKWLGASAEELHEYYKKKIVS